MLLLALTTVAGCVYFEDVLACHKFIPFLTSSSTIQLSPEKFRAPPFPPMMVSHVFRTFVQANTYVHI